MKADGLCRFDRCHQPGQRLPGVAEQHNRPGIVEQVVINADEARPHRSLKDDDVARLVALTPVRLSCPRMLPDWLALIPLGSHLSSQT